MRAIKCFITSESVMIGDATTAINPPLSLEEFSYGIEILRQCSEELDEQKNKDMGAKLFQRVFAEAALEQYQLSSLSTLALIVDDELAALPWEMLHDGTNWVARTRGIVRVASTAQNSPEIYPKSGNLRILAAISRPLIHENENLADNDSHIIDTKAHIEAFNSLEDEQFPAEIKLREHITKKEFEWEVSESYHAIHFVGNGNADAFEFETKHGTADQVDRDWMREQMTVALRGSLRLIAITPCFSPGNSDEILDIASTMMKTGVPAVIIMQGNLSEAANAVFIKNLYRDLALGKSIDEAVMDARSAMATDWQIRPCEWAMPVLYVNESLLEAEASLNIMDAGMAKMMSEPKVGVVKQREASPDPMMNRDEKFIGRRQELCDILQALDPERQGDDELSMLPVQVICLHGDVGMGKTAIATEATRRMLGWFDDIIWLAGFSASAKEPAGDDDSLEQISEVDEFLITLAHKCEIELNGDEDRVQLRESIIRVLSDGRRRLLILDDLAPSSELELFETLPTNCKAIVTSNKPLEMDKQQIHIQPMSSQDSMQLLLSHDEISSEEAEKIVHITGGHPMTMRLAISQIVSGEKSLDDILTDIENAEGTIFDHIFRYSLALAGGDGRKIFAAMAVFSPTASRKSLQSACGLGDLEFENAIKCIVELSLIESYDQGKRFGLHQLVQAKAQQQLESDLDSGNYYERAAQFFSELVSATAPMTVPEQAVKALGVPSLTGMAAQRIQEAAVEIFVKPAVKVLETELPNCLLAMDWFMQKENIDAADTLFRNLSGFLTARGYWNEAVGYLTRINDSLKGDGRSYAEASAFLGMFHERQERWEESITHYKDALEAARRSQNVELQANVLSALGTLYTRQRDWGNAGQYLEDSRLIFQQLGDETGEISALNILGGIYQQLGEWSKAIQYLEILYGISQRSDNGASMAELLNKLAECHQSMESNESAAESYNNALSIYIELGDRDGEGNVLNSLGEFYCKQSEFDQAIQFYLKSLDIKQETGDQIGRQQVLKNLALAHGEKKEWMESARAYLESFQLAGQIHFTAISSLLPDILELCDGMFTDKEFALPKQLVLQLTELIQDAEPDNEETRAALIICHGVFTVIGFVAACEYNRDSDIYIEALELARSLDEQTGAVLGLIEWLKGGSGNGNK